MPVTDLLTRVTDSTTGRPVISALAAPKAIGAATVSLTDVTNWTTTTAIHFAIYETTAAGIKDPTTQTDWKGTLSGTTVSNLAITGGTDRAYSTGAKVELTPTARFGKDLYDWGINHANQDGTLKTSAVQAALNIAATSTDWTPLANTPTLASSAGQREHVLQFTGVNYTDRLQAGTKLQIPRTGTTPTTSMAFVAASSQYASKTSPTGITFTDDFTCEAWVYLDSYTSTDEIVIGRNDANNGWYLQVTSTGQVRLLGQSAGSNRYVTSYQSLPLNKWIHIGATLDMSANTGTAYIDGVSVPTFMTGSATALAQATADLRIGNYGTVLYFNGKIANARVWSTIRTAAQIRDNMNQETPASTTGLVAHFKGNGSWNDSSSNANHLTAVGGAVNNSATHPYSATEYAIVTKTEYTGGNTAVTVFTGSNCLPNETLGTASYSGLRAPYGFPVSKNKWTVRAINKTQQNSGSIANTVWANIGNNQLVIPTGEWAASYRVATQTTSGSTAYVGMSVSLSTSATAKGLAELTSSAAANATASTEAQQNHTLSKEPLSASAMTTYYLNGNPNISGNTCYFNGANMTPVVIDMECAYI